MSISSSRLGVQPSLGTPAPALWVHTEQTLSLLSPSSHEVCTFMGLSVSVSSVISVRNEKASAVLRKWDEGFHCSSVYYYLFNF